MDSDYSYASIPFAVSQRGKSAHTRWSHRVFVCCAFFFWCLAKGLLVLPYRSAPTDFFSNVVFSYLLYISKPRSVDEVRHVLLAARMASAPSKIQSCILLRGTWRRSARVCWGLLRGEKQRSGKLVNGISGAFTRMFG